MSTIIVVIVGLLILGLVITYWKQILGLAVIGIISFYSFKLFGIYGLCGFIGLILLLMICTAIGWKYIFIFACIVGILSGLYIFIGLPAFFFGLAIMLIIYMIILLISNSNQNKACVAIIESFTNKGMAEVEEIEKSVKDYDKLIMKKTLNTLVEEVLDKLVSEGKAEVITMTQGEKKGIRVYKIKDITQGMNFVRREISLD